MKQSKQGFTLMEILLAMSILIVGLVGILALFPAGLNATRKAMEDTNAALIAESVYSSLRASARQTTPGGQLTFFHDGVSTVLPYPNSNAFPIGGTFSESFFAKGNAIGIPQHRTQGNLTSNSTAPIPIANYRVISYAADVNTGTLEPLADCFYKLGAVSTASPGTNTVPYNADDPNVQQYAFNIQLSYPATNPRGLYDVAIRVIRANRLVRTFYSQIFIPTAP